MDRVQPLEMLDGNMAMSSQNLNSQILLGRSTLNRIRRRVNLSMMATKVSAILLQNEENGRTSDECKKFNSTSTPLTRHQTPSNPQNSQQPPNTVGIIGGVSVSSTLIFSEKLAWWSSRNGGKCVPFIVCSDPAIREELLLDALVPNNNQGRSRAQLKSNSNVVVENLRSKRSFLEQSGASCIVMPCHAAHMWYSEVSVGCSVPFLDAGDCVARELKEAKLKPLRTCRDVRIGVLAAYATLMTGFYQEKLQNQGFEVVLPDKPTMEHVVIPAIEAVKRTDMEGARNLLRIAVQILLVRAVNVIMLASDEFQGLLPHDDPLLKKCIDPMDALARSTVTWAQAAEKPDKANM